MKYYSYDEYSEEGHVIITKSEQQIIDEYYHFWYDRMCKKFGKEHVDATYTKQDCIDDWIVIHLAWELGTMRGHQPTIGKGAPSQTPDQGTNGRGSTVSERNSEARLTALEARLAALEARVAILESHRPLYQYKPTVAQDCGCPVNTVCNSTACPRAMRVTCAVSTKEIEN